MHARKKMGITCINMENLRDKKGFPLEMLDVVHAFKVGGGRLGPRSQRV